MTCMICLNTSHTNYNLCNWCHNFIVCDSCYYNDTNLHTLNNCIHCRKKISKKFNYSFKSLKIILNYYIYVIIHILINIIYSNIFLYINFPRNVPINNTFSTTITHLLIINNISNFIIIPIIYTQFDYYYNMSILYSCVNILYSIIFFANNNPNDVNVYYTYYTIYFYFLTLIKFITFSIYQLIIIFNLSLKTLMREHNLQIIEIKRLKYNSVSTSQV